MDELQKTAAAFPKPSGHAIPSIIPSGIATRIQHLNVALLSDSFTFNLRKEVRPNDFRNINCARRGPDEVREYRENALVQIREANNKLIPPFEEMGFNSPAEIPR